MNGFDIKKIDLKNKILISLGSVLLMSSAIIYFLIIPTLDDIDLINEKIQAQNIEVEEKYNKIMSQRKLLEKIKTIEPQMAKLDRIFIDKNRQLEFITTLEGIAAANGIIQKINLPPLSNSKDVKNDAGKGLLSLDSNGSFSNIISYLSDIESLNYYINIKSFSMANAEDNKINLKLSADIYFN